MDRGLSLYLPNLLLHLEAILCQYLPSLSLHCTYTSFTFIFNCLSMLQQYVQQFIPVTTSLCQSADTIIDQKHLNNTCSSSSNPFEGSESALGGLLLALFHQSLALLKTLVSVHVCDMDDVSSDEIVNVAIKEALQAVDTCKVCKNNEDNLLVEAFSSLCSVIMESLNLLKLLKVPCHSKQLKM